MLAMWRESVNLIHSRYSLFAYRDFRYLLPIKPTKSRSSSAPAAQPNFLTFTPTKSKPPETSGNTTMANYPGMYQFNRTHTPCNPESLYHDISCGHRVKTAHYSICGSNCIDPSRQTPFICPVCVTDEVRTLMVLNGLSLESPIFSDNTLRDAKIEAIAQEKIDDLIYHHHHRPTVVVQKLDPLLQFYSEIDGAQDDGGFCAESAKNEPKRKYKRPEKGLRGLEPSTDGFRVQKGRGQGNNRMHFLLGQLPGWGVKTKTAKYKQRKVSNRALETSKAANLRTLVRTGPDGVTIGDMPISQLQPGIPTKVDTKQEKTSSSPAHAAQLQKQPFDKPGSNIRNGKSKESTDTQEDDATRTVRRILEKMTL